MYAISMFKVLLHDLQARLAGGIKLSYCATNFKMCNISLIFTVSFYVMRTYARDADCYIRPVSNP